MGKSFVDPALSWTFVGLLFIYYFLNKLRLSHARRKFAKENGCEVEPILPLKDPILGLDGLFKVKRMVAEHRLLDGLKARHRELGDTYSSFRSEGKNIFTCDPENLKTIWATDFNNYGVEDSRRASFEPSVGRGIMSSDGPFWEHSRAMIRPALGKGNFANLPAFDVHFKRMVEMIPKDGETIDMHPLFIKLVCLPASQSAMCRKYC